MRLDLKGHVPGVVEGDDAGVVHECRVDPRLVDPLGRRANVRLQQAVDRLRADVALGRAGGRAAVVDTGAEGLVDAVLAPGLRQHFQLGVGWLAAFALEVIADGAHLVQVQRQPPLRADAQERFVVGVPQRNDVDVQLGRLDHERRRDRRVDGDPLDDRVIERLGQRRQLGGCQRCGHVVALAGGGAFELRQAQPVCGFDKILGHGVGDAGEKRNFDGVWVGGRTNV